MSVFGLSVNTFDVSRTIKIPSLYGKSAKWLVAKLIYSGMDGHFAINEVLKKDQLQGGLIICDIANGLEAISCLGGRYGKARSFETKTLIKLRVLHGKN